MKSKLMGSVIPTLSSVLVAGLAYAAVTFDPTTGEGFVGKGDVQYTFDWNNAQLQAKADLVGFRYASSVSVETTWTCDRDAGPQTQERANTTTTSVQGLVDTVGRLKRQITGFNLLGWDGEVSETSESDGPAVGSCPTGWTAINIVVGEPVVSGGFEVSGDGGTTWTALLEPPVVE